MIGKPITLIIPPELHEQEREILRKLGRGERIDHFDTVRITKDGRRLPVSLTISPVRDAHGVVIGASKVARDISERKFAEFALKESERRLAIEVHALARLADWSTRLWGCTTLDEGMEEILDGVVELLGAQHGNIQLLNGAGDSLNLVAHRNFPPEFLEFFREVSLTSNASCARAMRSGKRVIIEDVSRDELYRPYRALAEAAGYRAVLSTPLRAANGPLLGMVSVHFTATGRPSEQEMRRLDLYLRQAGDFIARCHMEKTLREREENLQEADRRKNEFLALLAHELRNPLAPIRFALATARRAGTTAEQRSKVQDVIDRQVTHMTRLLDDLLDVSRITEGKLTLKKTTTELTLVLGAAIETARPLLDAKGHSLEIELPKQPVRFTADAVRLAQVFSNLLINAAKYTPRGGRIGVRAECGAGEVVVRVTDNGIGIAAEVMPRLFQIFSQAQAAQSEGGLGVGLSLARGLVALHGGTIEAYSGGAGQGSEFVVTLPLHTASATAEESVAAAPPATPAALRVLVVDDNRDAADTCATLLEVSGHRARTAYSGRQGLKLAREFAPHIVLLDIGLPDLSGYEVARELRALPGGGEMLLVAVTGWGQEEDRRRAYAAGFDQHMTKPLAAEALEQILAPLSAAAAATRAPGTAVRLERG